MPTLGSLFSGAGMLDLGLTRAGFDVIWHSEVDPQAAKVLGWRWPDVPNLGDVTTVDWSTVESPDLIAGGFPCPPFSTAGKQLGRDDSRYLWPVFADTIRHLRPRAVLLENVAALVTADGGSIFGQILGDLAEAGYVGKWCCLRASDVGAPHRRDRVFIAAYADGYQSERDGEPGELGEVPGGEPGQGLQRQRPGDAAGDRGSAVADPDDPAVDGKRSRQESRQGSPTAPHTENDRQPGGGSTWGRRRRLTDDCDQAAADAPSEPGSVGVGDGVPAGVWGPYEPAIARWEHVTGEPAPDPLDERGRLNVELTRWMMGAPVGWTDHPHGGLARSAAMRCYGNGVVVQVGTAAGRWLLEGMPS